MNSWKRSWKRKDSDALELLPLRSEATETDNKTLRNFTKYLSFGSQSSEDDNKVDYTEYWKEIFFPSRLPDEVQLLRWENLAVPACYLMVGTMQGMFRPLLNVYPLDLGATEAQQTTLSTIATLPAAFKMIYGFVSDNFPLAGYRRKPYMLAGWLLASFMMAALINTTDLTLTYTDGLANPPKSAPSIPWLSAAFFLYGIGMWFADVMADSIVAQKVRLEPEGDRGKLQSTCYASRFFGMMVSASISTFLYGRFGPKRIIYSLLIGPLLLLPLICLLGEERNIPIKSTAEQCAEVWKMVCSRSVWQPLGILYIFNLLQVPNAAWRQFLKSVLGFSASDLNILLCASYVMLYCGIVIYKKFFLAASWRRVYQACIFLNACFSALQLLLISGNTLGLSPFLFALGDEVFVEFLQGIQFLPCTILMVSLCPPGSEGISYAMFTCVYNSAQMLAPAISTLLLPIWNVSKEALEAKELEGLFKLTILTTIIQISPVVLIGWLPDGTKELHALSQQRLSGNAMAGGLVLAVLFGSMLYTLSVTLLNIVAPGWAGES